MSHAGRASSTRGRQGEGHASFSFEAVKTVPPKDLVIRFAFGAGISTAAALLAMAAGPRTGGLFLAFPAILPATLSLIEQEGTQREADHDDTGAIFGAASLLAFAALAREGFGRFGASLALPIAVIGWLACALLLYKVFGLVERRRNRASRR